MKKGGYVYILTNKWKTVLYTGVTSSLSRRVLEHQEKLNPTSFTAKYQCDILNLLQRFSAYRRGDSRREKNQRPEQNEEGRYY